MASVGNRVARYAGWLPCCCRVLFAVLPAVNLVTPKQFKVDLPNISIRVDPKQADLLETRVIDGRSYLLIPIEGDIAVNGQPVFTRK